MTTIIGWLNSLFGKCPKCGKPIVSFDDMYESAAKGNYPPWCTCSSDEEKAKNKKENKK